MRRAIAHAAAARTRTSPNPWVGAVIVANGDIIGAGATQPPDGAHAEIGALAAAGPAARGATLVVTLEPCSHHGRTGPCVDAIIGAGITRVVVGVLDPDPRVAGSGVAALRATGMDVTVGVLADAVTEQLLPYLTQRHTGRPYVVCKMATTIDGGTAAPDGSSKWITGPEARLDVHRLRAESDAIIVGAGTVRADDPTLTVRHVDGPDPLRVVLGKAPADARVHPCLEWSGDLPGLLDELGNDDVVQVLIEGGQTVARAFHDLDLIDRYVIYLAPALFGGGDQLPLLAGPTAPTIAEVWRGEFVDIRQVGTDLRLEMIPANRSAVKNSLTNSIGASITPSITGSITKGTDNRAMTADTTDRPAPSGPALRPDHQPVGG